MIQLDGFQTETLLYEDIHTLVYRAKRLSDATQVILKVNRHAYPSADIVASYQKEFDIIHGLKKCPYVRQVISIEKPHNTLCMVLEDCQGIPVSELIENKELSLLDSLKIALDIVRALEAVHANNLIHCDIGPSHILWNPAKKIAYLIDFGIATSVSKSGIAQIAYNHQARSLAYIAPEQTGRMNRPLDYRADFYSLGVTLFEMVTHQLPFINKDPLKLIHSHMSQLPPAANTINVTVPNVVANIVSKLMAKTGDERYQSTFGIKTDLRKCIADLEKNKKIHHFNIAQSDTKTYFQIPQAFSRSKQDVQRLNEVFDKVSTGKSNLLRVTGYAGVGKSSFVNELHRNVVAKNGHFIIGKFDQFSRDIPYYAFSQAGSNWVDHILSQNEHIITRWRVKLQSALGNKLKLITDLIPKLSLIHDHIPELEELSGTESQSRFNAALKTFLQTICTEQSPIALFLDDAQWSDSASLNLIETILKDEESKFLLIIIAYRDNEVERSHALPITLNEIYKVRDDTQHIQVQPMDFESINALIANTLSLELSATYELAELCYEKTLGNPFFLTQFLYTLYDENLISFSQTRGTWQWDIKAITHWAVTDNVAEFIVNKIHRLDELSQQTLKYAAFIGHKFDVKTLKVLTKQSYKDCTTQLINCVNHGFIEALDSNFRLLEQTQEAPSSNIMLSFTHDNIQHAAYNIQTNSNDEEIHFALAQSLLKQDLDTTSDAIFATLHHLNLAHSFIVTQAQKHQLVNLNLSAAIKAKRANAYDTALKYLDMAIPFLEADHWQSNYALALTLFREKAETEQLCGHFEAAHQTCDLMLLKLVDDVDKATLLGLKTELHAAAGQFNDALIAASQGIRLLGIAWPESDEELIEQQQLDFQVIGNYLQQHSVNSLLSLEPMTDSAKIVLMELLVHIWGPAINVNLNMSTLAVVKMVRLSMEYGNASTSPFGYVNYGTMLSAFSGEYQLGYAFGQLAVNLINESPHSPLTCKIFTMFGVTNSPWSSHLPSNIPYLKKALRAGLDTGEIVFASYSAFHILKLMLLSGHPLAEIEAEGHALGAILKRLGDPNTLETYEMLMRSNKQLQGKTTSSTWDDEGFSENAFVKQMEDSNHTLCLNFYHFSKMQEAFLIGDFASALVSSNEAEKTLAATFGWLSIAEHCFLQTLILIRTIDARQVNSASQTDTANEIAALKEKIAQNKQKMATWADNCDINFGYKLLFIEAELARLDDDTLLIMDLYDQAIAGAKAGNFLHHLAYANEAAGQFWLGKNKQTIGLSYIKEAYNHYIAWGAMEKARQLGNEHPTLLLQTNDHQPALNAAADTMEVTSLDLKSVTKAAQIISSEIQFDQLLTKLMDSILVEAGAQSGTLLLNIDDNWSIEASANNKNIASDEFTQGTLTGLGTQVDFNDSDMVLLPKTILSYVKHSHLPLILDDVNLHIEYAQDPYFQANKAISVLCYPIHNQNRIIGLVYLENNLVAGAFTANRLQVLSILASQAAISIDHALVHQNLEARVVDRTEQLNLARLEAEAANQSKSMFLATMSHEIRTPMNAIIGLSHLALKTQLTIEQKDYLNNILESAETLLGLLNSVLDYSKIEAHKVSLESIPFNLKEIIDHSTTMCAVKAREKNLDLNIHWEESTPYLFQGDPLRLQQILINLANNAVKFTEQGQVDIYISSEVNTQNLAIIRIEIIDTGVGMTKEQISRLFQSFSQADDSITRKYGGTGLGLAISKELIELMEGDIWVTSEPQKGATFGFRIPLQKTALALTSLPTSPPSKKVLNPSDYANARILLVEDNALNRQVAIGLLKETQAIIDIAVDGAAALEKLDANQYDLVFMDIQMPILDGFSTTRKIRENSAYQTLPIIAMTAHATAEDKNKCLQSGMDDYISKPLKPDYLIEMLDRWIDIDAVSKRIASRATSHATATDSEATDNKVSLITPLANLASLNVAEALARLKNNESLYEQLVQSFYQKSTQLETVLQTLFDDKDLENLFIKVHSLKSNAIYIGALTLHQAANTFELALGKRNDLEGNTTELMPLLSQVTQHLRSLINDLSSVLGDNSSTHQTDATINNNLRDYLTLIAPLLKSSDLSVEQYWEPMAKLVRGTHFESNIQKIFSWVEDVEFEKASALTDQLLNNLVTA